VLLLLNRDVNMAVCLFSDAPSNLLRASFPYVRIASVPFGIIMETIKFCEDNVRRQMRGGGEPRVPLATEIQEKEGNIQNISTQNIF
jgi:hypothetical protein